MSRKLTHIGVPAIAALSVALFLLAKNDLLPWTREATNTPSATQNREESSGGHSASAVSDNAAIGPELYGQAVAVEAATPIGAELHEDAPLDMYLKNIAKARNGDPRSQYRVFQALQKCRMAPKSEEQLSKAFATGSMSIEQTEEIKRRYDMCKEFDQLVPEIDAQIADWLHLAAEGGDPLAKGYEALLSFPNVDGAEIKSYIREALGTGESEAYSLAAMYYANVTPNDNVELYEAWLLIDCSSNPICDVARERERIKRQYRMFERLQISTFESNLREKLDAKQWDQVGF